MGEVNGLEEEKVEKKIQEMWLNKQESGVYGVMIVRV